MVLLISTRERERERETNRNKGVGDVLREMRRLFTSRVYRWKFFPPLSFPINTHNTRTHTHTRNRERERERERERD